MISRVVSKHKPLQHYNWGAGCDGWNLVDNEDLLVKQEAMPPGTVEVQHYHKQTQQFFYILAGTATFEIAGTQTEVSTGEGLHIAAGVQHRILNNSGQVLEFILCSQPATTTDRFNS